MNKGVYPEMQSSDGFRMDPDSMRKYLVPVLAGLIAILAAACVILLSVASSRNRNYLNLTMRGPEQIELSLNGSVQPCVITPKGDPNYLHLVLPVRTQA